MDLIEYLFKQRIRNIKISVFHRMLDQNITLLEHFGDKMPPKAVVQQIIHLFKVDVEKVTFNRILNLFAEGNPDAYNLLLSHPNGTKWLNSTLQNMKSIYL